MATGDGSGGGGLIFATEDWRDMQAEAMTLVGRHWAEVALDRDKIPLALNVALYDVLAGAGVMHVTTARVDGALVGYLWAMVQAHLHFSTTMTAFVDLIFLDKPYRRGRSGQRLIEAAELALTARGVVQILMGTKAEPNLGPLFKRMGYVPHETSYSKMIG